MGPNVLKFEKILSNFFKRKAVCVSSGTSALHIALESLGLKKGDEVILSSLNYIAALQAVTAAGLTPVLCDIRLSDFSLCTNDLKKKLTKKTRVIMPTHYGGNAGNIDEIQNRLRELDQQILDIGFQIPLHDFLSFVS